MNALLTLNYSTHFIDPVALGAQIIKSQCCTKEQDKPEQNRRG